MNKHFPGYYRPSDRELSKLWRTCTFILDANVLLNLYRYPKSAREDLLRVLKRVSNRLWIPHQAALEYQRNRLDVIAEQVQRFDDVKDVLRKAQDDLGNGLAKLQLKKRHSSINPDEFLKKVDSLFSGFLSELDNSQKEQPVVYGEDELRASIDSLFDNRVGNPPEKQSDLEAIYNEGKSRYEMKFPPGYEDLSKSKPGDKEASSFIFGGMVYRKEYGDLILWKQIIEEAKSREWKSVIFITDDDKEDWWWVVDSKGKKTIGPRPELVEEISAKAGVTSFYMYNSERFLSFANTYLKAEVEQETIDQVREIARMDKGISKRDYMDSLAVMEQTILDWLQTTYPGDQIMMNGHRFPDFVRVSHKDGSKTGYEVKYFRGSSPERTMFMLRNRLHDSALRGFYELSKGGFTSIKIVIVFDDEPSEENYMRFINRPGFEVPEGIKFIFGKVIPSDENSKPSFRVFYEQ